MATGSTPSTSTTPTEKATLGSTSLWQTNCIGTKNLLRLQEKHGFNLVFFSSAEVYGDYMGTMTEDVMEKNPIRDTYQMNDYAISCERGSHYSAPPG